MQEEGTYLGYPSRAEFILALIPREHMKEILCNHLANTKGSEKEWIANEIARAHPSRPRAKTIMAMSNAKIAKAMLEIPTDLNEAYLADVLLSYLARARATLLDSYYDLLGIPKELDPNEDHTGMVADKFKKVTKKKAKLIWDTLTRQFPAEDVAIMFGILHYSTPNPMTQMEPMLLEHMKKADTQRQQHPQDQLQDLRERLANMRRRTFWYAERLQFEIPFIREDTKLPSRYITTESESIRQEIQDIIQEMKSIDSMPEELASSIERPQSISELQETLEDISRIMPNIKQHQQRTAQAAQILAKLARVTTKEDAPPAPIIKFRREIQKLLSDMGHNSLKEDNAKVVQQIIANEHPLAAILELIDNDNLSLQQYEQMKKIALLHPNEQIVMAAIRGKLTIAKEGTAPKKDTHHQQEQRQAPQQAETKPTHELPPPAQQAPAPQQGPETPPQPIQPEPRRPEREFYNMVDNIDPSQLATQILDGSATDPDASMKALTIHALAQGKYGEAALISHAIESNPHNERTFTIPSALIKTLSLAKRMNNHHDKETEAYQNTAIEINLPDYIVEKQFPWNQALSLLTAAALMPPALNAPTLGVMEFFSDLKIKGAPATFDLYNAVKNAASHYLPLTPEIVTAVKQWREIQQQHDQATEEARRWHHKAARTTIKYAPAQQVLTHWLGRKGFIGRIINPVLDDSSHESREVHALAQIMLDGQIVTQEITQASKKVLPTKASTEISGPARQTLMSMAQEATTLAISWADACRMQEKKRPPAHIIQAAKDIQDISTRIAAARHELQALHAKPPTKLSLVAAEICLGSIASVEAILDGIHHAEPAPQDCQDLDQALRQMARQTNT